MLSDLELTHASFDLWLGAQGEDNRAELDRVKRILPLILEECCTDRQKTFIMHYFGDRMTIAEIAKEYGIGKPAVSKTIHRGLNKAYKYLQFCSPLFINVPQQRGYLWLGRK